MVQAAPIVLAYVALAVFDNLCKIAHPKDKFWKRIYKTFPGNVAFIRLCLWNVSYETNDQHIFILGAWLDSLLLKDNWLKRSNLVEGQKAFALVLAQRLPNWLKLHNFLLKSYLIDVLEKFMHFVLKLRRLL